MKSMTLATLLAVLSFGAQGAVTTAAQYRLGENDPGAAAGMPGAVQTQSNGVGAPLNRTGAPVYSSQTHPGISSTLAMDFDGVTAEYGIAAPISAATDNFGIEAWVRADTATGNAVVAYNGNTGTSGWGLFRLAGNWAFLYGGVILTGGAPVTTSAWTHLAVVRASGVTTLYVNGVRGPTSGAAPNVPSGGFAIAGNPINATEPFDGRIDEVRAFTFAPGAFVVGDLNLGVPVSAPVPSTSPLSLALLAVALLALGVFARRR